MKFHVYVVLIQEIKELTTQINVTVCHTLEINMQIHGKLGTSLNIEILLYASPPNDMLHAVGTFFSRD